MGTSKSLIRCIQTLILHCALACNVLFVISKLYYFIPSCILQGHYYSNQHNIIDCVCTDSANNLEDTKISLFGYIFEEATYVSSNEKGKPHPQLCGGECFIL